MKMRLKEIAELVGGRLVGDDDIVIEGVASLEEAKKGQITFLADARYAKYITETKASAIIVNEKTSIPEVPHIAVKNPYLAFARVMNFFSKPKRPPVGIHRTSVLGKDVHLGKDVAVGPCVVVGDEVTIGDETVICAGTYIGEKSVIGRNVFIHPNVTVREEVIIGNNVIIHSGAVIGSDGFGYVRDKEKHQKIPQIGTVEIQDGVEIGANVTIDRATLGKTVIGAGTKIDNLVQIAHNVKIGKNCLIISQVGISGSTVIGDNVILAGQAGLVGHITVGDNAVIGAQAGVTKSVPPNTTVSGYPAREHKQAQRVLASVARLPKLYEEVGYLRRTIEDLKKRMNIS